MKWDNKKCTLAIAGFATFSILGAFLFSPPILQAGYHPVSTEKVSAVQLIQMDLNKVEYKALVDVPGLGEKKAEAIIDYRNKHGKFETVEDLLEIHLVSEKDLENWRPYFYVK